jgi:hypothetical protein
MSEWKIIVPEAATNMCLNPSGEIAGNFAAVGGTAARSTTYAHYGIYSYNLQTAADNQGATFTLSALTNAVHYVTMRVRGTLPAAWDWSLDNANWTEPTLIEAIDASWSLYGVSFPAAQANASTTLRVYQKGAGAGNFYIDGINVVAADHWTTHIDGTQEGCEWNGLEHASTSVRSAYSRAGGRVYDLATDYDFHVEKIVGAGAIDRTLSVDSYALLPGGQLNNVKKSARAWSLIGPIIADDADCDLNEARQKLIKAVSHDAYPKKNGVWQPYRLRYVGGDVQKEIAVNYETGLGADWQVTTNVTSRADPVALNMLSVDPFFYQVGENSKVLDTNDSATTRYIAGRLRETGQWSALGLTANPTTDGTVYAIAYNQVNGLYYVGGKFTGMNGVAGRDYIASYDPVSATWATVGSGSSVNGQIRAIAIAPNGDVYIGGAFTDVGDANGDYVAYYDISAGAWASVSGGGVGDVLALTFGLDGILYIAGTFQNWNAIPAADRIVKWDGSAYVALGTGMNGTVYALETSPDGNIYAGGVFTTGNGVTLNQIGYWNGTTFVGLDSGFADGVVYAIKASVDGRIYAGGSFTTTTSGVTANGIGEWDGSQWSALGDLDWLTVYAIETVDNSSLVYIGGYATSATQKRVVLWNGESAVDFDIDISTSTVYSLCIDRYTQDAPYNYDLMIGFNGSVTSYFSGAATVANNGSAPAYPKIIITRTGGTTATLESIRNETTGDWLWFDYALLDGETLTIDLSPTDKSITSSMFGRRLDAVLPNSDFGKFSLLAGSNTITAFVNTTGSPTITAYMLWRDPFDSFD